MQTEESQKQGADTVIVGSPAPSAAAVGSCGWMKNEAKDGNFMTNLKHRLSGFIHAPMDEHKACFKTKMQKMAGKFSLFQYQNRTIVIYLERNNLFNRSRTSSY